MRRDAVQLVSHDSKNNTAVQHYTYSLEIAPLCREDLVLLPYNDYYLRSLGGMGPLVLVYKIFSSIVFLDPKTLQAGEITGSLYWKKPFSPLMTSRQMTEFYVLECQLLPKTNGKYQLGIATVCLSSEVGEGREWIVQTHLGALLNPGDLVMGYLLDSQVFNNDDLEKNHYKPEQLQDIVLVRKYFPAQKARRNKRMWRMKKLDVVTAQGGSVGVGKQGTKGVRGNAGENQYDDEAEFEDEVERDPELRKDVAVYKLMQDEIEARKTKQHAEGDADDEDEWEDDDAPEIPLEELLDELNIEDTAEEAADETAASIEDDADDMTEKRKKIE
ncbi:nonsense-mediated mRNA decay protein 3 [Angomonas deanei]|uniref:Uncharacterized protein n=1 Tax=Angomonas deanei TaxID=59799 RepID=S9VIV8_9TRYP|nr:nonsense-mediated mRNA decay protein 3 [Angomonas deanei]EPY40764.1 nonsense-mediated mRNA decay protein 3 [Angomonas deanei]CAD2215828.1 hypothetical protein, conserved [Angomonas deanei]|eukprot:EPY30139.1 nonsense-mediated mRNA decay protein 3 [Angomonas deanei]